MKNDREIGRRREEKQKHTIKAPDPLHAIRHPSESGARSEVRVKSATLQSADERGVPTELIRQQ